MDTDQSKEWRKQCLKKISTMQRSLNELREFIKECPQSCAPPLKTNEFEHDFVPYPNGGWTPIQGGMRAQYDVDFVRTEEGREAFQKGVEEARKEYLANMKEEERPEVYGDVYHCASGRRQPEYEVGFVRTKEGREAFEQSLQARMEYLAREEEEKASTRLPRTHDARRANLIWPKNPPAPVEHYLPKKTNMIQGGTRGEYTHDLEKEATGLKSIDEEMAKQGLPDGFGIW